MVRRKESVCLFRFLSARREGGRGAMELSAHGRQAHEDHSPTQTLPGCPPRHTRTPGEPAHSSVHALRAHGCLVFVVVTILLLCISAHYGITPATVYNWAAIISCENSYTPVFDTTDIPWAIALRTLCDPRHRGHTADRRNAWKTNRSTRSAHTNRTKKKSVQSRRNLPFWPK